MEKFVPYEKLSKKKKRELNAERRGSWGDISPVTRKPQNSRAYNRRKTQAWKRELPPEPVSFLSVFQFARDDRLSSISAAAPSRAA